MYRGSLIRSVSKKSYVAFWPCVLVIDHGTGFIDNRASSNAACKPLADETHVDKWQATALALQNQDICCITLLPPSVAMPELIAEAHHDVIADCFSFAESGHLLHNAPSTISRLLDQSVGARWFSLVEVDGRPVLAEGSR
nr:hypothetical protein CFP56_72735 [Quercus suber]